MQKCLICENPLCFRWTDTHGVGACVRCGAPYTIYHYDNDKKRVEKPPEITIKDEWLPLIKKYWEENKRNCSPGSHNSPRSRYEEVATKEDFEVFHNWMDAHKDEAQI